ncbi:13155_t:CDS:2 [Ambispora gerdemannii]|uniref:13155_t:CDS:1 n=1 Tax=Ambispora gerdemannii TaxID=144530 RepID=A0A9N9A0X0_9GLOM|nr:13155_t:CDS:2 [Ambispora gerdemannii]
MIVLQSVPNDIHNGFNTNNRSLEINNATIANYSAIAPQTIPASMYQTNNTRYHQQQTHISHQQQLPSQPYVYPTEVNNQQQYAAVAAVAAHSRSSSTSSLSRNPPTPDNNSFAIDSNTYYQQPQQHQNSNNSNNNSSPNSSPPNQVISTLQNPSSVANTLSLNMSSTQSVPAGFYQSMQYDGYAAAEGIYANQANSLQQAINQQQQQQAVQQVISQQQQQQQVALNQQQSQLVSVVDPCTLPPIVQSTTGSNEIQPLIDATSGRINSSIFTINNTAIAININDNSISNSIGDSSLINQNGGATNSTTTTTLAYHSQAAASQAALINGHFLAPANSILSQQQQQSSPHQQRMINRRRSDEPSDTAKLSSSMDRPQKVYSFVSLAGINTKKRPRRRYDEIERHYACNYEGCTKAYGTLNHLNAHVQMQRHGPKRHPSEFKELRKQWRRQKREEEERKATEAVAANVAKTASLSAGHLMNTNLSPI